MELYHHGVKGQKWGVRRYQYADGSLTPAGRKRYRLKNSSSKIKRIAGLEKMKVRELVNSAKTRLTGSQYVDTQLRKGLTLSRIQTSKEFEKFAFYATYKKADVDKYMGLFGKNLLNRSKAEARNAEKKALASGSEDDVKTANEARNKADNTKVYQLKLQTLKKLKIPSDDNASDITAKLLKEQDFRDNLVESIRDSKEKMRRPTQQILFDQAQKALSKDVNKLSDRDKKLIYKAFNLSLVNHNEKEIAAQNRFYSELKKKGYNALLDYNDREYSSYHAKRPTIVFDVDSVKLRSVAEANPKVVDKLYKKYNAERIAKETVANTVGLVSRCGAKTVGDCANYVQEKMDKFVS